MGAPYANLKLGRDHQGVAVIMPVTNMIESPHMQLRKIIKTRGHFPSNEAAIKLLWLALRNIHDGKVRSAREWKLAMNQFAVLYGDRFIDPKN
jgi:putative transposase